MDQYVHRNNAGPQSSPAWDAKMIRPLSDQGVGGPGSFVQKKFEVERLSGAETLRISALGLYRAFINGRRVGDDQLTPGWTSYDRRLSYQMYDVAELLTEGENTIEIWLGDGWLRSPLMWTGFGKANVWGDHIAAIAELRARPDGHVIAATDETWRSGEIPVRKSGIYFGETYDARVVPDVSAAVVAMVFDHSTLVAHECGPVRELGALAPIKSWVDDEGRTIFDFGQNVGGYVAFTATGDAGAVILVEHAEILDQQGRFYNVNYRSAEARIEYTLAGKREEHYRPCFTFQGYRYARVTVTGAAKLNTIASIPITSVPEPKATFSCANALVNRLVENTIWSQRANFIEVPTDCPQRDERLGWTGDAQVFAATACYLADSRGILTKFVRDMMVDQADDGSIAHVSPNPLRLKPSPEFNTWTGSTGWGDAISVIPWTLYLHYGDATILGEAFEAMTRWNDFVWSISEGPIVRPPAKWDGRGFTFGDWLQPQNDFLKAVPTMGDDAAATIYLYISCTQIAEIARHIGRAKEAEKFNERARAVRDAFQQEFITPAGRLLYDDQSSYALAFLHDLIPKEHIQAAKAYFKAAIERSHGRIGTGFIGTPALLPALVKVGEPALAASVFLQEEVPGWLAQVKRGATTIWERWDGIKADGSIFEPAMNSYNHYAYGAVCQWLFEAIAGFRPDPGAPGFRHIIFEPTIVPSLSPIVASHDAVVGRVEAGWTVNGDAVEYTVTVPELTEGALVMAETYTDITVDGEPLSDRTSEGKARCRLAPGTHKVTFRISRTND
ncbi:alpha-L-rhamnosidase [Rhizobium sp. CF142]|nr:alpha-L-rhamnosidase [Rhizobium sp. CF142]